MLRGLGREHFDRYLSHVAGFFDGPEYVCTDAFRPGVREIAGLFGVGYGEALFIDDVARVGEAARAVGAGFIGVPTAYVHSFQRQLMREAGVRHTVSHLDEITEELLRRVEGEMAEGRLWPEPPRAPVRRGRPVRWAESESAVRAGGCWPLRGPDPA